MKTTREKYLGRYGVPLRRPVISSSLGGISQAVVIPVLAEKHFLFKTLASIARNSSHELRRTLVICVVNNHKSHPLIERNVLENQETLGILADFICESPSAGPPCEEIRQDLNEMVHSDLRLACIDASSPGQEIPDCDGGVGTARKIGMDAALTVVDGSGAGGGVICSLDADTLVQDNYLAAVSLHFSLNSNPAAVMAYAHQMPEESRLRDAICGYEIFLRSYVLGLHYAGSPYAFHAIGSTMACTAEGYVRVRGMNRRAAAEDFYFLDKLAKLGRIGVIGETTVFPSPRLSARVPFGTGKTMMRSLEGSVDEYRLYEPRIFRILEKWLSGMNADPDRDADVIMADAGRISVRLAEYLRLNRFESVWRLIRRNCREPGPLLRQFHGWFDGLKTLKLVRHLDRTDFPSVSLLAGLKELMAMMGRPFPFSEPHTNTSIYDQHISMLEFLRDSFPDS